ncbi:MAG: DNA polymerase III subunit gamma/tau [Patescibacteria group bacterium]|nr:DNA polymerase III subunit gamma/tau [Patescibacteria group bacterium]
MAVLYRKYRPQTFADVLNQKYIIRTLKNQVTRGEVAHAYLFTGSRGVGKTSVARIFAKAVNCQNPKDGEPCGECPVCLQVMQGNFLDLVEIDAASYTGVDNVRDIIEHVRFAPSAGKYKIIIIDEVHMLSKPAFNALLKTLEEPPKHAIFILATTEIGKVLPTIVSRTQRFDFKALSEADIEHQLKKILEQEGSVLPEEIVALVAQNAEGSVRDALSLLGKVLTLGKEATAEECRQLLGITDLALCEDLLGLIEGGQGAELPAFFDRLSERGQDFVVFNRDFLEYLRKVLVEKVAGKGEEGATGTKQVKTVLGFSKNFSVNDLIYTTRLFLKSYKEIQEASNPQIPLLLAALEAALKRALKPATASPAGRKEQAANAVAEAVPGSSENNKPRDAVSETAVNSFSAEEPANLDQASLEEVSLVWAKVIENIRKHNTPLANLVKNSSLLRVENGRVILGVKFKFHKQSLESPKSSGVFMQALREASGKNLGIYATVINESPAEADVPGSGLADALT